MRNHRSWVMGLVLVPCALPALSHVVPPAFEENLGQVDARARYYCRLGAFTLFLTAEEAVIASTADDEACPGTEAAVLRLRPEGMRPAREILGEDPRPGVANYFIGRDPAGWRTGVARYGGVRLRGMAPGVEMRYYVTVRGIELDVEVAPGVDASRIVLAVDGADDVTIDDEGGLRMEAAGTEVRLRKPGIYQDLEGGRVWVCGGYEMRGKGRVGFWVGPHERGAELVVDPELEFSTYLGGSSYDHAYGIAVDSSGSAYVTGSTSSQDFPLASPLQGSASGYEDAFVAKLDAGGTSLVYSTYLGGSGEDYGLGIAVDVAGSVYLTGTTSSTDYPVANALQSSSGGARDVFVTKVAPSGATLVYSTYLGGVSYDDGTGIAVDLAGGVCITGETYSPNFPIANPAQGSSGGQLDAFVAKIDPAAASLTYATYLGGSKDDVAYGIAMDLLGSAYVVGWTKSTDFPVASPLQGSAGGNGDAFVTQLAPNGAFLYSTYLGGSGDDAGYAIAVDATGCAYVTGATESTDFPVLRPLQQSRAGGYDAFVAKLTASGTNLVYST